MVVVGNPNTLLCTEDHMVKKYGASARCWSNFIHWCLSKNTFCVPEIVEKSVEKQISFKKLQSKYQHNKEGIFKQLFIDNEASTSFGIEADGHELWLARENNQPSVSQCAECSF